MRFIETTDQDPSANSDLDIENPMLVAVIRIMYLQEILYSVLFIAEHTFSPLLILGITFIKR